tara:strand:+ start:67 stop:255 length:189 start_codon:yes stop_codon:yes gene_type:complete
MKIRHVNKRYINHKGKQYAKGWVLETWDEDNQRWLPVPSVDVDIFDPPKPRDRFWDKIKFWK